MIPSTTDSAPRTFPHATPIPCSCGNRAPKLLCLHCRAPLCTFCNINGGGWCKACCDEAVFATPGNA
jgi:hypothetical protein